MDPTRAPPQESEPKGENPGGNSKDPGLKNTGIIIVAFIVAFISIMKMYDMNMCDNLKGWDHKHHFAVRPKWESKYAVICN